jgi:hypothetical protein
MNRNLFRIITPFTLFVAIVLALSTYLPLAAADDNDNEVTPIDLETDDDENGIPDEFETEFRALMTKMGA